MSTPSIQLIGLRKSFGGKSVLNGVDLTIPPGESTVLLGRSGSGKSVLLKCILGLLTPDAGQILIDGADITRLTGRARRVLMARFGMLFQNAALFDSLSVWENVAFALLQRDRMARREAREQALENLSQVGLAEDVADLDPSELSGGMRKRVGLARAIATKPDVIFFDEPTTGLDPIMGSVIDQLIVSTVRRLGVTALSITHDIASARTIADRIAMLYDGKIVWTGLGSAVDSGENPYVDQFIHGRTEGPMPMDAGGRGS